MVMSLLKKFFKRSSRPTQWAAKKGKPAEKPFNFLLCNDEKGVPLNTWYRPKNWSSPNLFRMETEWSKDWKSFSRAESVIGMTRENGMAYFVLMGDQPDFQVFLERERDNPVDRYAIKVMGSATVEGKPIKNQLGYLSKTTASLLAYEKELEAKPRLALLPDEDGYSGLRITVLVRAKIGK